MIIVRTTFQLKFGAAKEAKTLIDGFIDIHKKHGIKHIRAMMDLTGESYTLEMETGYDSLAAFEENLKATLSAPEMGALYSKFVPLVNTSRREIFTVVG
ncbi:MAG: NIPSNAP family protein [Ignavibacteriae bacterium]|nr:NIPSNAP family protein [Ignavibacteriota bacterium]